MKRPHKHTFLFVIAIFALLALPVFIRNRNLTLANDGLKAYSAVTSLVSVKSAISPRTEQLPPAQPSALQAEQAQPVLGLELSIGQKN